MATTYEYIASNNRRIFILSAVFVLLTLAAVWAVAYGFGLGHYSRPPDGSSSYSDYVMKVTAKHWTDRIFPPRQTPGEEIEWVDAAVPAQARAFAWRAAGIMALVFVLLFYSPFAFMEVMVLNAAHAVRLQEADHRELYRLAGTVFMTAGLPCPRLYVLADDSLNAFTTGFSPRSACLVITQGALNKLSRPELEAVIAHEAAHAACGDCRLMLAAVSSVLLFSFLAEVFFAAVFVGARRNIFSMFFFRRIGGGLRGAGKRVCAAGTAGGFADVRVPRGRAGRAYLP